MSSRVAMSSAIIGELDGTDVADFGLRAMSEFGYPVDPHLTMDQIAEYMDGTHDMIENHLRHGRYKELPRADPIGPLMNLMTLCSGSFYITGKPAVLFYCQALAIRIK